MIWFSGRVNNNIKTNVLYYIEPPSAELTPYFISIVLFCVVSLSAAVIIVVLVVVALLKETGSFCSSFDLETTVLSIKFITDASLTTSCF